MLKYALVGFLLAGALLLAFFWLRPPVGTPGSANVAPPKAPQTSQDPQIPKADPEVKYESKNLILCDSDAETEIKELTKGT